MHFGSTTPPTNPLLSSFSPPSFIRHPPLPRRRSMPWRYTRWRWSSPSSHYRSSARMLGLYVWSITAKTRLKSAISLSSNKKKSVQHRIYICIKGMLRDVGIVPQILHEMADRTRNLFILVCREWYHWLFIPHRSAVHSPSPSLDTSL